MLIFNVLRETGKMPAVFSNVAHLLKEIFVGEDHCCSLADLECPKFPEYQSLMQCRGAICDFLLLINSNLPAILHRLRHIVLQRSKITKFVYPSCV